MSDILNHYFCAREALERLPQDSEISALIMDNYDAFRLGSQGPDFLYYGVLDTSHKKAVKAARAIHSSHINDFFFYALEFAAAHPEYAQTTMSYLAGFASHHALDTLTHPMIFSRTGTSSEDPEDLREVPLMHKLYEVLLDTAMTQYEYMRQAVFESPEKVFIVSPQTQDFLHEFYGFILPKVFGEKPLPKHTINASLSTARRVIMHFKDPFGSRRKITRFLERRIGKSPLVSHMYYPMYTSEFAMLNVSSKPWPDPVTGEIRHDTYPSLFEKAIAMSVDRFKALYGYYKSGNFTQSDIDGIFGDLSYLTGRPSSLNESFKYFDEAFKRELIRYS